MEIAPFHLVATLGKPLAYAIYLLIGVAFGAVLEMAGFANSRKLAAQFYLSEMTVLKVMFTGIVTAMVLIFLSSAVGLLDFNQLYVPPTYLWPGIVGGLIMGVGFIIGGFCPGTSLVAVASLKVDGWFFLGGTLVGIFLFGETVGLFQDFWYGSFMGRMLLPEWLGWSVGATVFAVVVMALGAFWAAEKAEAAFGSRAPRLRIPVRPVRAPVRLAGAGALAGTALVVMGMGYPTPAQRWDRMADARQPVLDGREVMMHPGEFVALATNHGLRLNLVDVRGEGDFNRFHLVDARRVDLEDLGSGRLTRDFLALPPNAVTVLVSNDETDAVRAWQYLAGENIPNIYILEGGMNGWLGRFAGEGGCPECTPLSHGEDGDETLRWRFEAARGADYPIADPDHFADRLFMYQPVLQMEVRETLSGGCG